jgi:transcriptional/translational regulatory protein YebC/TACO1
MFEKRGRLSVARDASTEEKLMEIVLEAGADDLTSEDDVFEIVTSPEAFGAVQQALLDAGVTPTQAAIVTEAQNNIQLEGKKAEQCLKLLDLLEDHDDVQGVHANLEIADPS